MPLKAAKPTESAESAPAAGGAVPSTFVLRAVPEPKDGPLAQPPRTPGLPLTLPGIPVTPDNPTPSSEPIRDAAPHTGPAAPAMPEPVQDPSPHAGPAASMMPEHTQNPGPHADPAVPVTPESFRDAAPSTGTVVPPTGEFGPVTEATTGPELPPLPPQSAPSAWQPDGAANSKPSHTSNTPAPGPISLEPQPWPPNQNSAPVQPRDAVPLPAPKPISLEPQPWPPAAPPTPLPASMPAVTPNPIHEVNPEPEPEPVSAHPTDAPPALATPEESAADPYSAPEWKVMEEDLGPKPTPVREFDAVAEAVLDPAETDGGAASPFAEPMSRINEAVKMGRINEAAEMAEQTVAQATAALGPQHHEVLRIRELTAYIAYLAGDALRSFHLSLDLAVLRHRLQDPRAAYGNIQSAAAAWRAVRDPLQGLHLGRDLITVWTELAADAGPAADDLEQLEKARTRMGRLAERARALDAAPYAGSPHAHGQ
ncbi:tetratricopeptide repeat protein [Streptomyces ipomoeae]|nr:tetratricopeptide repeat protein [Streptomyces ipomoeae]